MKFGIFSRLDFGLFVPSLILSVFGLATLYSINTTFFTSQFIYTIFAIVACIVVSQVSFKSLPFFSKQIYIASLFCLFLLFVIGIESRGSVRWIDIFGIRLQFSEIFKPLLPISLATFLTSSKQSGKQHMLSLFFLLPIVFLIYRQPDLGNALLYLLTVLGVLLVVGLPLKYIAGGMLGLALSAPFIWNFLHDYQKQRVLTLFQPTHDPLGISYNAIQATIAVGSGMFFGKGLGEGTQSGLRFLPERHTDFIFATLAEKLGFVGSSIVLVAFAFLMYRILVIVQSEESSFGKIFAITIFFSLLLQFFTNVGMNVGIMPITGVTLPFLSYGGSSLLASFLMIGLLSSLTSEQQKKHVLEIR